VDFVEFQLEDFDLIIDVFQESLDTAVTAS